MDTPVTSEIGTYLHTRDAYGSPTERVCMACGQRKQIRDWPRVQGSYRAICRDCHRENNRRYWNKQAAIMKRLRPCRVCEKVWTLDRYEGESFECRSCRDSRIRSGRSDHKGWRLCRLCNEVSGLAEYVDGMGMCVSCAANRTPADNALTDAVRCTWCGDRPARLTDGLCSDVCKKERDRVMAVKGGVR